jgi:hypothetical protein
VLIISQQNRLYPGVEQSEIRSITFLILFGIKRVCLSCGSVWTLYLCIRWVKIHIVVVTETYHICQMRTNIYPTSCFQGWLHMKRTFWGIIGVDFDAIQCQMLIIYSAFVRYSKEKRNKMKQSVSFRKAYDSVRKEVFYNILILSYIRWN